MKTMSARYTRSFTQSARQFPDKLGNNGRDITYGGGLKVGLHHRFGDQPNTFNENFHDALLIDWNL